ncbi:hypothetical protein I5I75_13215 [Pseudomonas aeruginosa]|nr:hypothetical protein [Pseudomonas aeruginosa]
MAFAVELEEWVGAHWHRFITRHASGEFEAARVTLESMRRPLGMLFRALGGGPRGGGAPPPGGAARGPPRGGFRGGGGHPPPPPPPPLFSTPTPPSPR